MPGRWLDAQRVWYLLVRGWLDAQNVQHLLVRGWLERVGSAGERVA